jgi:hypothetical protein
MNKYFFIILISFFTTGCEIFTIGTKSFAPVKEIVEYNQNSALGTIYLFKAELDSNNVPAATQLIAKPEGEYYLAFERYEKFYDIFRIKRMISNTEITKIDTESQSGNQIKYALEFNYKRKVLFTTLRIENNWYITEVGNNE